jgi:8-amino-7-oxononanoate synthase
MSRARVLCFRHNDADDLDRLLAAERASARRVLVATDGVFSMDGDLAPLDRLSQVCGGHDAWLLNDDAHGLGLVAGGRGSVAAFPGVDVPLQMGTLSKALGSYGGYVCGSRAVIDLIRTRARSFVYTTGLPPASAAAALAALDIVQADPELCARPIGSARRFARALDLPQPASAIVPIRIGSAHAAIEASRRLEDQGFLVVAIRPPTVPEATARLRVAFTAAHSDEQVDALAEVVADLTVDAA